MGVRNVCGELSAHAHKMTYEQALQQRPVRSPSSDAGPSGAEGSGGGGGDGASTSHPPSQQAAPPPRAPPAPGPTQAWQEQLKGQSASSGSGHGAPAGGGPPAPQSAAAGASVWARGLGGLGLGGVDMAQLDALVKVAIRMPATMDEVGWARALAWGQKE